MEIRDLQQICWQQANDKGFHADRPNTPDKAQELLNWQANKLALMHSELSEALEEIRKGHSADETYYPASIEALRTSRQFVAWCNTEGCYWHIRGIELTDSSTPEQHAEEHVAYWENTAEGHPSHEVEFTVVPKVAKPEGVPSELADVIIRILNFCGSENIDMQSMIEEKLAYNATREHMHGKKF